MTQIPRRTLLLGLGAVGAAAGAAVGLRVLGGSGSGDDAAPSRPEPARERSTPPAQAAPVLAVEVIRRQGWGAREPQGSMQEHRPRRLTLHHTAVALEDDRESPARLRQHQAFHMDDRDHDYPDLAYHFMVDRRGNVFEGRDVRFRGDTATEYDPTGHFLVCCEGDYDSQQPTAAQLQSVAAVFAWAAQEYGIAPESVRGHRDYAETSCPGDTLHRPIRRGRWEVMIRSLADSHSVELQYLSPASSRAAVARIESGGSQSV